MNREAMRTILVSGATNGLGATFVEAYRVQPNVKVLAVDRLPTTSTYENVESLEVDVTCERSINSLVQKLHERPIDLVLHSAGIRGLVPAVEDEKPDDVPACETMNVMDMSTLTRAFQINAAGTFMLLRALLPNLRKTPDPKVIVMASRMGSIGNNEVSNRDAGGAYAYRASKAAVNAIIRSFAVDVTEISFILCHPGRVETNLVRCTEAGAITAEESVREILPLIEKWGKTDSGKFYDRFGESIQW